eukprot:scaffold108838_cov63-Phaeocystis_antarctica.AAC.8
MAKSTSAVGSKATGWAIAGERKWLISRASKRVFHDCMKCEPGSITTTREPSSNAARAANAWGPPPTMTTSAGSS